MSLDKRLTEVFTLFQEKDKNIVGINEIPTVIWALGLVPSEAEMKKAVGAMVGEESAHTVHLGAFLATAKRLILDRRFPSSSRAELESAMRILAKDGRKILEAEDGDEGGAALSYGDSAKKFYPRGTLPRSDLSRLLTMDGETFSQDEADELLVTLPLKDEDCVNIEAYSSQLVPPQQSF